MAVSGSSFAELMAEMMAMPVDPTDPGPLSNRPATMYGTTIPFHILSWVAVFARLYTRFRVIRDPGWDDLVVVLAALFNLGSLVGFLGCMCSLFRRVGMVERISIQLRIWTAAPKEAKGTDWPELQRTLC
jgi:hypothetical protein